MSGLELIRHVVLPPFDSIVRQLRFLMFILDSFHEGFVDPRFPLSVRVTLAEFSHFSSAGLAILLRSLPRVSRPGLGSLPPPDDGGVSTDLLISYSPSML